LSSLRNYWRRLSGTVHPDDAPIFASSADHTFNLDYPPPAFIGDIENAPIVVLMANGGFDPNETPREFAQPGTQEAYIRWLHGEEGRLPSFVAPYYARGRLGPLVRSGDVVLVNAVGYRSVSLSGEPENRKLAKRLPSVAVHKRWVQDELVPSAQAGQRFLIVHRNGMWGLSKGLEQQCLRFSRNPVSPSPSLEVLDNAMAWLRSRSSR
jgi:hypothetical protein